MTGMHRHCDRTITELGQERDRLRVDLEACTIDLAMQRERADAAERDLQRIADRFGIDRQYLHETDDQPAKTWDEEVGDELTRQARQE